MYLDVLDDCKKKKCRPEMTNYKGENGKKISYSLYKGRQCSLFVRTIRKIKLLNYLREKKGEH